MWPRAGLLCLMIAVAMPCRAESDAVSAWKKQIASRLSAGFPPQATKQSGRATVGFTLDRSGKLISNELLQSSGSKELDLEAVAIVDRAQPFPAPPPEIKDGKLKIEADLNFPPPRNLLKEDAALHAKLHGICRGC